jgi:hypothetical protein
VKVCANPGVRRFTGVKGTPGYGGSSGVKGREEPRVLWVHWCKGQGGARGTEDLLV